MECETFQMHISSLSDRERLGPLAACAGFVGHYFLCSDCRSALHLIRRQGYVLRQLPTEAPPSHLKSAVMAGIEGLRPIQGPEGKLRRKSMTIKLAGVAALTTVFAIAFLFGGPGRNHRGTVAAADVRPLANRRYPRVKSLPDREGVRTDRPLRPPELWRGTARRRSAHARR